MRFSKRLKRCFERDRVICRLLAAWCCFILWSLLGTGDAFAQLRFMQESGTLATMGIAVGVGFFLLSLLSLLSCRFHSDAWVMLGAAAGCVAMWLYGYNGHSDDLLFTLAVLAVFSLFVIYFVHQERELWSRVHFHRGGLLLVTLLCGIVSGGVIALITCLRYLTFSAPNFDFGLFVNMFHHMKETGLPTVTSERDMLLSHFAVHLSPIYYLLLPAYWLFPTPLTLQIGQAVFLAAGVIPTVLLARHFGLSARATALAAALYSFYPAISTGCFYDIHENCFLPFFLLFTFYFFEKERPVPMFLCALCVLAVKEDAAVYLMVFALYILLSRRRYGYGISLAVLSAAYFAFACYWLRTYGLGTMNYRYENLILTEEDGLLGVLKTALLNPGFLLTQLFTDKDGTWDKVAYLLQMLLPLGFLPFCTKKASRWLLCAPLLINLLTYYVYQYDLGFQYHFGIAAFLVYAALQNLAELKLPTRHSLLALSAAACFCLYLTTVCPTLGTYVQRYEQNRETYAQMEEILDTIPEDATVCASTFLLPHLAERDVIYETYYHDVNAEGRERVDYVVLDARYASAQQQMQKFRQAGYTVTREYEGLIIIMEPTQ